MRAGEGCKVSGGSPGILAEHLGSQTDGAIVRKDSGSSAYWGTAHGPEKPRCPPPYLPPVHDVIDRFDAFQRRV